MAQLDALRKIIREEVKAVFREEISGILKEAIITNRDSKSIVESSVPRKPQVPNTPSGKRYPVFFNTRPNGTFTDPGSALLKNIEISKKLIPPVLSPGNPLNNILAETAMAMNAEDYGNLRDTDVIREVPVVESVNQMFTSARKSSNLEAIEINAVPDFSHMIAKMGI